MSSHEANYDFQNTLKMGDSLKATSYNQLCEWLAPKIVGLLEGFTGDVDPRIDQD